MEELSLEKMKIERQHLVDLEKLRYVRGKGAWGREREREGGRIKRESEIWIFALQERDRHSQVISCHNSESVS